MKTVPADLLGVGTSCEYVRVLLPWTLCVRIRVECYCCWVGPGRNTTGGFTVSSFYRFGRPVFREVCGTPEGFGHKIASFFLNECLCSR